MFSLLFLFGKILLLTQIILSRAHSQYLSSSCGRTKNSLRNFSSIRGGMIPAHLLLSTTILHKLVQFYSFTHRRSRKKSGKQRFSPKPLPLSKNAGRAVLEPPLHELEIRKNVKKMKNSLFFS